MPLADLLRPTKLTDCIGQDHLVEKGRPIFEMVRQNRLYSLILWGPPGVGKTTIARILAKQQNRQFFELSAVAAGKKDVEKILTEARELTLLHQLPPVLFLDEIHRFNKAQQDFLLPAVEQGVVVLIGATTENPSFEVIPALLSRTKVLVLKELSEAALVAILGRGLSYLNQLRTKPLVVKDDAKAFLCQVANGDARQLLNIMEQTVGLYDKITTKTIAQTLDSPMLRYDKAADLHYDTISAFIKSLRASDPDAALYYLARMVASGEDPLFIARRMVIFASEDIGLAMPTALVVANAAFRAVETIGLPEAQINLAHAVTYLAQCPKDRRAYDAYFAALNDVNQHGNLPIPLTVRNAPTKLMKELGYGQGYQMYGSGSHLPKALQAKKYLQPKPTD